MNLKKVADEVADAVLEVGRLKKAELLLQFRVAPDDYVELCELVLKKHPRKIKRGKRGRGGGGLEAVYERRGRPGTTGKGISFVLAPWEQEVVEWFDRMPRSKLEDLLGDLAKTLRKLIQVYSGKDRRGEKSELATALLISHGRDLIADPAVRKAVAKAAGVKHLARWHPGKASPLRFVRDCGLPEELAGILAPEKQPSIERLEGRVSLQPLQPFQEELKASLRQKLRGGGACRSIASLPTGAGKTRVAVEVLRDSWADADASQSVLWLAHTDELCEQAFQCVKEVWESSSTAAPITAIRYWGRYSTDKGTHSDALEGLKSGHALLVTTPVRLFNALTDTAQEGFSAALVEQTRIVVIDEAHRAGAATYLDIAHHLSSENPDIAFVGLTATPYRTEYADHESGIKELKKLFTDLIESRQLGEEPRQWLQDDGVLAQLKMKEVNTEITIGRFPPDTRDPLSAMTMNEQGVTDQQLKIAADNHQRRLAILPYILEVCRSEQHASILYFGPSVQDAQAMVFLLRTNQIKAAFVGGETRTPLRRQLIGEFKRGDQKVLCNCEVLTTGFDAPRVTHLMIARPTVSQVLWEQMLGRGLRGPKFGGTDTCVVYDFVDNFSGNEGKIQGFYEYRRRWRNQWAGQ